MHSFNILLRNLKDKYILPWKYLLPFIPLILIYLILVRPIMGRSMLAAFVWLADIIIIGIPLGICFGFMIGKKVGGGFGDSIFYPKQFLKTPPLVLSPVRGMVTQHEYDEAISTLNEILEEKPFSPEPYLLLVEIYANELNDYRQAMELIEAYFNQKKIYVFDENVDLLMLYADICAEYNCLDKARKILSQEVARKGYSEEKRKHFKTRLEAIIGKNNALE